MDTEGEEFISPVDVDAEIEPLAAKDAHHIATYVDTVPEVDGVTWADDVDESSFPIAYDTVKIKDSDGQEYTVEVVPENMVYFIDSGTGTTWKTTMTGTTDANTGRDLTSLAYQAVKELAGDALLNEYSDHSYDEGSSTWGYEYQAGGITVSGKKRAQPIQSYANRNAVLDDNSAVSDKYRVGLRSNVEDNFAYYLTLEAGTYTLATGFYEFYQDSDRTRIMKPTIYTVDDSGTTTKIKEFDEFKMETKKNNPKNILFTGSFTLEQDSLIRIHYAKGSSGENGSMSWLAVSKGEITFPKVTLGDLNKALKAAQKLNLDDYATHSETLISHAMKIAEDLIRMAKEGDESVTQSTVDTAEKTLNEVVSMARKKNVNETRYTSVPVGEEWLDTEGDPIQAHGGGFLQQEEGGKPIYYWAGEDKTHNTSNFNGISLYSSRDLLNWEYRNTILQPDPTEPGLWNNKIERPKLIYNEANRMYVLYGHWEDKSGYNSSQICVATCKTADGDYQWAGHWRPGASTDEKYRNWRSISGGPKQYDNGTEITDDITGTGWGTGSRDFTIYVEQDNSAAYLVSAEDHATMRIYRLNDSFTDVELDRPMTYQLFNGGRREAPALVKIGEYYFIITSGQSGWYPNQDRWSYTKDITDPDGWKVETTGDVKQMVGLIGNNTSFYSQPTNIMTVSGSKTSSYVYMGDRWNSKKLGSSTYVWLPLSFSGLDTDEPDLSMDYHSGWSLNTETGEVVFPEEQLLKATVSSDALGDVDLANDGYFFNTRTSGACSSFFKPVDAGGNVKFPFHYQMDFGGVCDLSRLDIAFNTNNGSETRYDYTVESSSDGTNWKTIVTEKDNPTVGFKSHDMTGKTARYLRLNFTKCINDHNGNSATWAAGLVEVQAFGRPREGVLADKGLTAQIFKLSDETAVKNVYLQWETDDAATSYEVYRAESEAGLANSEPVAQLGSVSTYEDYGLPARNDTLYYQVKGKYNGRTVCTSSVVSVDTYASLPRGMRKTHGWSDSLDNGELVTYSARAAGNYSYGIGKDESGCAIFFRTNRATNEREILFDGSTAENKQKYPELSDVKFEAVNTLTNPQGEIVVWAHYEKAQGYSTGAQVTFTYNPKTGKAEYSGLILPNGMQARDRGVYVDDDGTAYILCAGCRPGETVNTRLQIHRLNARWNNVDTSAGVIAEPIVGPSREAPGMIKKDGIYYLFASQNAGWLPTQGMYVTATNIAGPWSAEKSAGDMSTFSSQQNGSFVTHGGDAILHGYRWWKSPETGGQTFAPMQLNNGYATAEFFENLYYNPETGKLIPERTGKVLSTGKQATLNGSDAAKTVDGDYRTISAGEKKWPSEWIVNLGEPCNLTGIQVAWYIMKGSEAYYPYNVYGSTDGINWTKILDKSQKVTDKDKVNEVDYGFTCAAVPEGQAYRYVKLEVVTNQPMNNINNGWYTPQLYEVKVLGRPVSDPAPTALTVTFDYQYDGKTEEQAVEAGGEVPEPVTPVREGCRFDGWYTDSALTQKYDFSSVVRKGFTLYAKWIEAVTVTFAGEGILPDPQTLDKGGMAVRPGTPAREGYTFGGWYSDETFNVPFDFSTPVNGDITLYAKWIASDSDVPVRGISIDKRTLILKNGEKAALTVTVAPENATNKNVSWTVSDPNVIEVDIRGNIIAVGPGKAAVTVCTEDGGYTASCEVTVLRDLTAKAAVQDSDPSDHLSASFPEGTGTLKLQGILTHQQGKEIAVDLTFFLPDFTESSANVTLKYDEATDSLTADPESLTVDGITYRVDLSEITLRHPNVHIQESVPVVDGSKLEDTGLTEQETQAAKDAAASVEGDLDTVIAEAAKELNAAGQKGLEQLPAGNDTTAVKVIVYMKVTPMDYRPSKPGSKKASLKLDITPVYKVLADNQDRTELIGETEIDKKAFESAVEIKVTLPDGFVSSADSRLLAAHYSSPGKVFEWLKTALSQLGNKYIAAFSTRNFSEFELMAETPVVRVTFHKAAGGTYDYTFDYSKTQNPFQEPVVTPPGKVFAGWGISPDADPDKTDALFFGQVTTETIDRMAELAGENGTLDFYPIYRTGTTAPVTPEYRPGGGASHVSRPSGSKPEQETPKRDNKPKDDEPEIKQSEPETPKTPELPKTSFVDVSNTDWFLSAVEYVCGKGIMAGNGNRFSPNDQLTRGMMAQILYNMEGGSGSGSKRFPDVAAGDWFAKAAAWAAENNIMSGYSNGNFGPNDVLTREQLAAALYRYAQSKGLDVSAAAGLEGFRDGAAVSDWAVAAVRWAVANGLLSGKSGGLLDPAGKATRAEVASILMRFCQNIANT